MPSASLNLLTIAHQTMIDAGFKPDVPEPVLQELNNLKLGGQIGNLRLAICGHCCGRQLTTRNPATSTRLNMRRDCLMAAARFDKRRRMFPRVGCRSAG